MSSLNRALSLGWRRIENFWFGASDPRTYALLRVAFSVVALLNLIDLWFHRATFFSDAGIIDREAFTGPPFDAMRWSVFQWIESGPGVTSVFLGVAVALICLGLGWMPRLMILIVFVFQVSYTYRGAPVVHGWDILLRIQAFILLCSPLGPSLITWWRSGQSGPVARKAGRVVMTRLPRYGLLLTQWQLAVIYWQTVWLKVADVSWRNGEFISYFMLSIYSRFQGTEWADRVLLSAFLSYATLLIELAIPLLLWNRKTRWLGFLLGIGLHFSILVVAKVWLFSLAILVPYLAFLERSDFDRLAVWRRRCCGKAGRDLASSDELLQNR